MCARVCVRVCVCVCVCVCAVCVCVCVCVSFSSLSFSIGLSLSLYLRRHTTHTTSRILLVLFSGCSSSKRAQRASERSELSARADKGDSKQLRAPGNSDRKQRAAAYGCTQNWSKRRRLNSNSSIESKRCPSTKIALPVHLLRQVQLLLKIAPPPLEMLPIAGF